MNAIEGYTWRELVSLRDRLGSRQIRHRAPCGGRVRREQMYSSIYECSACHTKWAEHNLLKMTRQQVSERFFLFHVRTDDDTTSPIYKLVEVTEEGKTFHKLVKI